MELSMQYMYKNRLTLCNFHAYTLGGVEQANNAHRKAHRTSKQSSDFSFGL